MSVANKKSVKKTTPLPEVVTEPVGIEEHTNSFDTSSFDVDLSQFTTTIETSISDIKNKSHDDCSNEYSNIVTKVNFYCNIVRYLDALRNKYLEAMCEAVERDIGDVDEYSFSDDEDQESKAEPIIQTKTEPEKKTKAKAKKDVTEPVVQVSVEPETSLPIPPTAKKSAKKVANKVPTDSESVTEAVVEPIVEPVPVKKAAGKKKAIVANEPISIPDPVTVVEPVVEAEKKPKAKAKAKK